MIASTTINIRVKLSAAITTANSPVTGHFVTMTQAGFVSAVTPIHTVTQGVTPVVVTPVTYDIANINVLKNLQVTNADTAAITVILEQYDGTTARTIATTPLSVGATLSIDSDGVISVFPSVSSSGGTTSVQTFANLAAFPATGAINFIYIAADTNLTYRWDGAAYVVISSETTQTVGNLINGATAKTTPVDADMVGLMDSAAGNLLKKLSWLNIKSTLKAYFDTIYQPANSYTSGSKNLLINAGFVINNGNAGVPYVSAAALASGATGHECWKAGTGGGDYSFTQLKSNTQITIAASKTLIQVIEDANVQGTAYVLSWTGTAQARYAVNSATPAGSYASSPILITGQTVGTTMSVEFNTGTLKNPQLELGAIATNFDFRDFDSELRRTQRYFQTTYDYGVAAGTATRNGLIVCSLPGSAANYGSVFNLQSTMRSAPTLAFWDGAGNASRFSYFAAGWVDNQNLVAIGSMSTKTVITTSAVVITAAIMMQYTANARL